MSNRILCRLIYAEKNGDTWKKRIVGFMEWMLHEKKPKLFRISGDDYVLSFECHNFIMTGKNTADMRVFYKGAGE